MASSDSDDDDGDYGLSADAAAALLVRVQRRPVVRHPEYPHGPDGAHCGTTADGDALLCARGNGMRALESASLSAVLCGLPSLSAAVRLAGMCAGSGNPLWLWSLASEQRPTTNECYARYVRCIYASGCNLRPGGNDACAGCACPCKPRFGCQALGFHTSKIPTRVIKVLHKDWVKLVQLYAPDSEQFAQLVYDVQELRDSEDPAEATALLSRMPKKFTGFRLSELNLGVFIPALALAGWLPTHCYTAVLSPSFGGRGSLKMLRCITSQQDREPEGDYRKRASAHLLERVPELLPLRLEQTLCAARRCHRGHDRKEIALLRLGAIIAPTAVGVDPDLFKLCLAVAVQWREAVPEWNICPLTQDPVPFVHTGTLPRRDIYFTPRSGRPAPPVCASERMCMVTWNSRQVVLCATTSGLDAEAHDLSVAAQCIEDETKETDEVTVARQRRMEAFGVRGGHDCQRGPVVAQPSPKFQPVIGSLLLRVAELTSEIGGAFGAVESASCSVCPGHREPASVVALYETGQQCEKHADRRNGPGHMQLFCLGRHDVCHGAGDQGWQLLDWQDALTGCPEKSDNTLRCLGARNLSCVFGDFDGGDLVLHGHAVTLRFGGPVTTT